MNLKQCVRHILVADDHADSADSLAALLHLSSDEVLNVVVAFDGHQALQAAERMPQLDVAVLDIEMPVINGFQAASAIRHRRGNLVRLIAVSGNPDMVRAAREGSIFDAAILKPIDVDRLLRLMHPAPDP